MYVLIRLVETINGYPLGRPFFVVYNHAAYITHCKPFSAVLSYAGIITLLYRLTLLQAIYEAYSDTHNIINTLQRATIKLYYQSCIN